MQNLKNKPFQELPGGKYDQNGFYYSPNGSFWDPDGEYFNSDGYDAHHGYYNEKLEYCPGAGWIDELMCYEDQKEEVLGNLKHNGKHGHLNHIDENDFEEDGDLDEIYEDIDYDKLIKEEECRNIFNNQNENPERKVFKPKNLIENEVKIIEKEPEYKVNTDMLFNKIPESKIPKNKTDGNNEHKEGSVKKETKIEVDSLFL